MISLYELVSMFLNEAMNPPHQRIFPNPIHHILRSSGNPNRLIPHINLTTCLTTPHIMHKPRTKYLKWTNHSWQYLILLCLCLFWHTIHVIFHVFEWFLFLLSCKLSILVGRRNWVVWKLGGLECWKLYLGLGVMRGRTGYCWGLLFGDL